MTTATRSGPPGGAPTTTGRGPGGGGNSTVTSRPSSTFSAVPAGAEVVRAGGIVAFLGFVAALLV